MLSVSNIITTQVEKQTNAMSLREALFTGRHSAEQKLTKRIASEGIPRQNRTFA
jgi:hypothetical protein